MWGDYGKQRFLLTALSSFGTVGIIPSAEFHQKKFVLLAEVDEEQR